MEELFQFHDSQAQLVPLLPQLVNLPLQVVHLPLGLRRDVFLSVLRLYHFVPEEVELLPDLPFERLSVLPPSVP